MRGRSRPARRPRLHPIATPYEACRLLVFRARSSTDRHRRPELIATAEALCELDADTAEDLLAVACSLADGIKALDDPRWDDPPPPGFQAVRRRCLDRAASVLARGAGLGLTDWRRIENEEAPAPLHLHPGYRELLERLKQPQGNPANR